MPKLSSLLTTEGMKMENCQIVKYTKNLNFISNSPLFFFFLRKWASNAVLRRSRQKFLPTGTVVQCKDMRIWCCLSSVVLGITWTTLPVLGTFKSQLSVLEASKAYLEVLGRPHGARDWTWISCLCFSPSTISLALKFPIFKTPYLPSFLSLFLFIQSCVFFFFCSHEIYPITLL